MISSQSRAETVIKILIISLFFLYAFSLLTKPLADPDTSWHIKTGEYIYENRTIPQDDPFSYAEDKIPFVGRFILTQYWLAQIIFHLIYSNFGTLGLVLLGAATFTGIIFFVWRVLEKKGFYLSMLLTGAFTLLMMKDILAVRPQMFTFLFTVVTIFLFERYKERRSKKYLVWLPLIMLVWANMHGGFIYGVVVMFIYLIAEYMALFLKNRSIALPFETSSREQIQYLVIICIASLALSMINPNTYKAFLYALTIHSQNLFVNIAEFHSPFSSIEIRPDSVMIRYWIYIFVCAILLRYFIVKRYITPTLLIIFSVSLSFMSIRYIPLFTIVATSMFRYIPFENKKNIPITAGYPAKIIAVLVLSGLLFYSHPFKGHSYYQYKDDIAYPVTASKFLKDNGIKGNILASYNKSSFLLFQLFPDSRIYADSRYISEERYLNGLMLGGEFDSITSRLKEINNLVPEGIGTIKIEADGPDTDIVAERASWRNMLEKMKVEIIVYEAINYYSGDVYPIVFKLIREDDWKLIHADGNVMIFIKNLNKYKDIINKFNKPKSLVYDEILVEGLRGIKQTNVYGYYTSLALGLLLKGVANDDTLHYIETARAAAPDAIIVSYCKALYLLMIKAQTSG
jgi:hypothetical protein